MVRKVTRPEAVVVRTVFLQQLKTIIEEAAEVIHKLPDDKWEKYGARDFLADEMDGSALMLEDLTRGSTDGA